MEQIEMLELFFTEGRRRLLAEESAVDVLTWANRELMRMASSPTGEEVVDIPKSIDIYDGTIGEREDFFKLSAAEQKRMFFPWASWNSHIDPLPGGMLMTLAGASGAGKTTYGECIAEWYARLGYKVAYFHFELSHTVMFDRRASRWTGLTVHQLKNKLDAEQMAKLEQANAFLRTWTGNIQYVHCPGSTMEAVTRSMKNLHADGKCDVAIVDYLEKAQPSSVQLKAYGNNTYQREADNVEQLKSTAERLDIPVVMLSQLNKKGKGAEDLDSTYIRGAGEKTEKANVVVLIRREMDDVTGDYSRTVDVRIDKNTLGSTGFFRQQMTPECFSIHEHAIERVDLPVFDGR